MTADKIKLFKNAFYLNFFTLGIYVPFVKWFGKWRLALGITHVIVFSVLFVVAATNKETGLFVEAAKKLAAIFYLPQIAMVFIIGADHIFIGWRRRVIIKEMRKAFPQFSEADFRICDKATGMSTLYEFNLPDKRKERWSHFKRNRYWIWCLVIVAIYSVACYEGIWQIRCLVYSFATIFLIAFEINFQKYYPSFYRR